MCEVCCLKRPHVRHSLYSPFFPNSTIPQPNKAVNGKLDDNTNGAGRDVNGAAANVPPVNRGGYADGHSSVHPQGYFSMATEQQSVGGSFMQHQPGQPMHNAMGKRSSGYAPHHSGGFDLAAGNGQVMTRAERRVSNMQLLRRDSQRLTRTSSFQMGSTPPGGKTKQHRMAFDQAKLQVLLMQSHISPASSLLANPSIKPLQSCIQHTNSSIRQESLLTDAANLHKAFAELARVMQDAHERAERLVKTAHPLELDEEELEGFYQGLRKCVVFSGIQREDVPSVCGLMVQESLSAGVSLMRQDDRVDDNGRMYLIRDGSCDIFAQGDDEEIRRRAGNSTTPTTSYGIKVGTISRHHVFGDYAIVTDTARSATVVTAEPTTVLSLTKTLALSLGFKYVTTRQHIN